MPLFKGVSSKSSPKKAIAYITNKKKASLISIRNLFEDEDYAEQFKQTQDRFGKGDKYNERKYYHFKLSCDRKDTTASRLVDFDFKVKSSAMKILDITDTNHFDIDYMFYRLQIINVLNDTHKRYWISEYAPLKIKIHTLDEQKKIVQAIQSTYTILEKLSNSI